MRVLVVEDNAPVAESIRTMLEARKYAANVVTDGAAGLDHLLRRCYDAAVIDVRACPAWTASRSPATPGPRAYRRRF